MTTFLHCVLHFLPNRFCFKPEPRELVWKSVTDIMHRIVVSIFLMFLKTFQKLEPGLHIYQIPGPNKLVLGPVDVFGRLKITNFFTVLAIFHEFGLIRDICFSYICSRQYGISRFSYIAFKKSKYLR